MKKPYNEYTSLRLRIKRELMSRDIGRDIFTSRASLADRAAMYALDNAAVLVAFMAGAVAGFFFS